MIYSRTFCFGLYLQNWKFKLKNLTPFVASGITLQQRYNTSLIIYFKRFDSFDTSQPPIKYLVKLFTKPM